MKVYDIVTSFSYGQIHSVVAENMAQAERVFLARYSPAEIKEIRLHSEYVQVQYYNEQAKEVE
jgi:hypothetical protein